MMVVVLCCATAAATAQETADARLQEAKAAFDEATRLRSEGKYTEAMARGEHALALREAVLGAPHADIASCLNLIGDLSRLLGDLARAEPLLQRALAMGEASLGQNHPDVARILNNLSLVYWAQGEYGRAEALSQRAIGIYEAALGKGAPLLAGPLNNLANIYSAQALFLRAEPLYQRALAIWEESLGKNHPQVALALTNLASLYTEQGLYSQAEPLFQRGLAIREAALGENHPDLAYSLGNLATLYQEQGLQSRAEPLLRRALAIEEAALGKNHPQITIALTNLGSGYQAQGLYSRAEPLYQRALAIREAALGKNHPDVAYVLNNLASLYKSQGHYDRAEPLLQRAVAVSETGLGRDHSLVASSLNNLASFYALQGKYGRAEPLLQRARTTFEKVLGEDHPSVADSLNDLAQLHMARHQLSSAIPLLTRAFAISEQRLRREALDFSEMRLASFLQMLRAHEERLYALARAHPADTGTSRLALTAALLLKGRSLAEMADTSRTIYRSLGAEDREVFERLRGLRTQLAMLSLGGPGPMSPAEYQRSLKQLAAQGDTLEADLARRSAPLRMLTTLPAPGEIVDRTAAALPRNGALIEFIAYTDRPLGSKPGKPGSKPPSQPRYLALVLLPEGRIRALDLGPAAPIDQAASRLRDALANRDAAFQVPAEELYRLAFRPLRPLLGGTRQLFLSPDGQLSLVPFAVLHDGRGFLMDSFDFTYLTSGRDLLPRPQVTTPPGSVVVFADPDFNGTAQVPPASSGEAVGPVRRSTHLEQFFSTLRADVEERAWVPLPGTRQEAEAIQQLMPQAQLFLGAAATKEQLLRLPTPGVLHLASHGFFLEDAPAAPEGSRAVGHFGALGDGQSPRPPDPLLRSGLMLAGAGAPRSPSPEEAKARPGNSMVTALELSGLDLWGTQLVVLSACDTGRGDIKLGQGVYGLRRALVVAGAETVVTSLWKVNDGTTHELMEAYYRNLLAGRGRAGALHEAMRSLREARPHPHYWAPFIVLGRDAPLSMLAPTPPGPPAPESTR
jgi:CHAT domain-containing protein/tetratricopeptide (TPR) repeat protein